MCWRGITPDRVDAMPWYIRSKMRWYAAEWEKVIRGK
jgi:hypothetical protein